MLVAVKGGRSIFFFLSRERLDDARICGFDEVTDRSFSDMQFLQKLWIDLMRIFPACRKGLPWLRFFLWFEEVSISPFTPCEIPPEFEVD